MKITYLKESKNKSLLAKLESLEEELKSIKRQLNEYDIYHDEGDMPTIDDLAKYVESDPELTGKIDVKPVKSDRRKDDSISIYSTSDTSLGYRFLFNVRCDAGNFDEIRKIVKNKITDKFPETLQEYEDDDRDGEPEIDYHVTGDELEKMKSNRFNDPKYFDKDEDGEFFVTGYVANYEYSPAEGGDYYIEGWYPVCSKAFDTIEQARQYLNDSADEFRKDNFRVSESSDNFYAEEESKYIAHEEYKYFVEPKAKRYSRTEKGHGWDW